MCFQLDSIAIPEGVEIEGEATFTYCLNLRKVVLPSNMTRIPWGCFNGCALLEQVNIPQSVTKIEPLAFFGCQSLESVILPPALSEIGEQAFFDCEKLNHISIPRAVTHIGMLAFSGCNGLTCVDFQSIESLCGMEFDGQYSNPMLFTNKLVLKGEEVEHLVIPDGVTEIRSYAFGYAMNLKTILIPPSVETIGEMSFPVGSSDMETVYMLCDAVPQVDSNNFSSRKNITLYVPGHLVDQYKTSSFWKEFKAILPLPDDFQGIGEVHEHSAGDVLYDLQGRRLQGTPQKGIYIKDGRVLVK